MGKASRQSCFSGANALSSVNGCWDSAANGCSQVGFYRWKGKEESGVKEHDEDQSRIRRRVSSR